MSMSKFEFDIKGVVISDSYGYLFRQHMLPDYKWIKPVSGLKISDYYTRFLGAEENWDHPEDPDGILAFDVSMNFDFNYKAHVCKLTDIISMIV